MSQIQSGRSQPASGVASEAGELSQEARERSQRVVEEQKGWIAAELGRTAKSLERAGENLEKEDQSLIGRFLSEAGHSLQSAARSLEDEDVDGLLRRAESYARNHPGVFLLGAAACGALASRLLKSGVKSAAPERDASSSSESSFSAQLSRDVLGEGRSGETFGGQDTWSDRSQGERTPIFGPRGEEIDTVPNRVEGSTSPIVTPYEQRKEVGE